MNFKEIYEKSLVNAPNRDIATGANLPQPIMTTGIISPESTILINPGFYTTFGLDKDGMNEVLEMLESRWANKTEEAKNDLMNILWEVYAITELYLGGKGFEEKRKMAYWDAKDDHLNLSEVKGKRIGLCAERAAIGHQLLSILQQAGLMRLTSFYTSSFLTTERKESHAFIILEYKGDEPVQYIFDIENPLTCKQREDTPPVWGVPLYPMTAEEYEAFKQGKSIAPQSIYEKNGWSVVGDKRFFGQEDIRREIGEK